MDRLKQDGVVKGFGRGRQVPKRLYSLEDLRLNKIQPEELLAPSDDTLGRVRTGFQVCRDLVGRTDRRCVLTQSCGAACGTEWACSRLVHPSPGRPRVAGSHWRDVGPHLCRPGDARSCEWFHV